MKTIKYNLDKHKPGVQNSYYPKADMADLPKMDFEKIVDRFKGKKYKPSSAFNPQEKPALKTEKMKCYKCGEEFEIKIYGPRHVRGACPCGGTTVMG